MIHSERIDRMTDTVPDYYRFSEVYNAILAADAVGLDAVTAGNEDLRNQLRIRTATWGLRYWEGKYALPVIETDSYEDRRSRLLSSIRGTGNFSAGLIESVAAAFSGGEVSVRVDIPAQHVYVKFIGKRGIPDRLDDLQAQIENIIHAHLGLDFEFSFLTWGELTAANKTWGEITALNMTWGEFETWKP